MKLDPSAFVAAPELFETLEKKSSAICCEEGYVLFRQGDAPTGVFLLHQGEAVITMDSPAGAPLMQVVASPGSLLGLPGMISKQAYTLTVTARAGAQLSYISREEFLGIMQSDPQLSLKILEVLASEASTARRALSDL